MIAGTCSQEGTAAYAAARPQIAADHWRGVCELSLSSFGLGSYLGAPSDAADANYAAALQRALELGVNVIDTAINYRHQRSERALGRGLAKAIEAGTVTRDQVFVCTKGGYIPFDGQPPADGGAWIEQTFVTPGLATWDDIVDECHCMSPSFIKHQVDASRGNLGLETIDLYYVHNPEQQRRAMNEQQFYDRLTGAFRALEECVAEGKIQWYGTATWDGYRVPRKAANSLSLEKVLKCAEAAGGAEHHFGFVQLPFNFQLVQALMAPTQAIADREGSFLEASYEYGVTVFTSVPLMQGQLRLGPEMHARFNGCTTDAQRLIQFARSAPGITAPLVGMSSVAHVEENARVMSLPVLTDEEFNSFFG